MLPKALQVEAEQRTFVPQRLERESAKVLAFKLGNIPVRTVENWQAGRCLPNSAHWMALCDLIPEFRQKTLEWMAHSLGVATDDELRLVHELQTLILKRRNGGGET